MTRLNALLCAELKRQLEAKGRCAILRIPSGGDLLWRWFLDLSRTRRAGFAGPEPISYSEIEAYGRVAGWPIEPRHVAILCAMDEVWLEHVQKRAAPLPDGMKASPPVSTTPLTAGMVDAIFG